MVGVCKVCGRFKYNLHNKSLTEIPWLCYGCRELANNLGTIVQTRQQWMAPSVTKKLPIMFSIKRLKIA